MKEDLFKLIFVAILTAGVSIIGTTFYLKKTGFSQTGILSPEAAAQKAIEFINKNMLPESKASLVSVTEENGLYKFRLKIEENEYTSYVTKNGKILFPREGIDLESDLTQAQEETTAQEIPTQERPDVKLFVMSLCSFGLQAQKMFLPVYDLLKDKAEMGVYFVNYIMHEKEEIDENLRQYCTQKEEKEKYYQYLKCFVQDGDVEKCLNEAKIDKDKMNSCISETDKKYKITELYNDKSSWLNGRYPKFDVHTDLNENYGIRGSPTIVINDTIVEVNPRSPEKFKEVVCQAFNTPPEECAQKLSETPFSPGFGLEAGSSSGGGQCK